MPGSIQMKQETSWRHSPARDEGSAEVLHPIRRRRWRAAYAAGEGAQTQREAAQILAAIELRGDAGQGGNRARRAAQRRRAKLTITVKELGDAFSEKYTTPRLKDPADYRYEAKAVLDARICPMLGGRAASTITSLDVERLRDSLLEKEYAGATVIGTLACLSKMFVWGRRQGLTDCGNPASGVERPIAATSLDFFSRLEVAQTLKVAEQNSRTASVCGRSWRRGSSPDCARAR